MRDCDRVVCGHDCTQAVCKPKNALLYIDFQQTPTELITEIDLWLILWHMFCVGKHKEALIYGEILTPKINPAYLHAHVRCHLPYLNPIQMECLRWQRDFVLPS